MDTAIETKVSSRLSGKVYVSTLDELYEEDDGITSELYQRPNLLGKVEDFMMTQRKGWVLFSFAAPFSSSFLLPPLKKCNGKKETL